MDNKKHCRHVLQNALFLIGFMMITSCGKQGVISAKTGSAESENETIQGADSDRKNESDSGFLADSATNYADVANPDFETATEVYITLEGGTGKATIKSPAQIIRDNGQTLVKFIWTSKNYDYMRLGDKKYLNENEGGESTFTIEVEDLSKPLEIVADTVAMSKPHEIEYTVYFDVEEENSEEELPEVSNNQVVSAIDIGIEGIKQPLEYADQFEIIKYGDYSLIIIKNDASYLVVPEGKDVPANLPEDVAVLKQPLNRTYLVSSSVMDLIRQCGAIDNIALSGTKEADWCIEEAKAAMKNGNMIYAGKYSAPDYEMILGAGCNLAIENTMIYHKPEVKDKLEELGIPVIVERSSYEKHPMGRLEWIKVYGLLYGKEDIADAFFKEQSEYAAKIVGEKIDVSVAFFYVTAGGMINARLSTDYVAKMIEMAGGTYCLTSDKETDSSVATMNMQMEDFYVGAGNADILIYNSTIGGEIESIDELIAKNSLFKDFKAVKEGNVYCTSSNFFQETTGTAEFMNDLQKVYNQEKGEFTYLVKLK